MSFLLQSTLEKNGDIGLLAIHIATLSNICQKCPEGLPSWYDG